MEKLGINIDTFCGRILGDGNNILFWEDAWLGNYHLKDKFSRLYRFETMANASIKDRVRHFIGRLHGELADLDDLIRSNAILDDCISSWRCNLGPNGEFLTKVAAIKMDEVIITRNSSSQVPTLHNNLVPQKVGIFIWRAIRCRIPVREELDPKWIDIDTLLCPMRKNMVESVDHALVSCKVAKEVWEGIFKWWGSSMPANANLENLFVGSGCGNLSGYHKKICHAIEWVTRYLI
ncbi:uncharacterized protein [Rutidosis leptorrhynchoides]|uniref:uncharacterized protein n=1 Tax=Rutidosis leptorrhynchoides TaxID=125765 RepID=UPI003A993FF6